MFASACALDESTRDEHIKCIRMDMSIRYVREILI